MKHDVVVLGGTSGLGLEISRQLLAAKKSPLVIGRTAGSITSDPTLRGAEFLALDLTAPIHRRIGTAMAIGADMFFWVAGTFHKKSFSETTGDESDRLWKTHILGPRELLRQFIAAKQHLGSPFKLVVVSSTSSWRLRDRETEYCMVQAAKATFARQIARELDQDLPGSSVLLVNPGGIRTEKFWSGQKTDISQFMDPAVVAKVIIDALAQQQNPFEEFQIIRGELGQPIVQRGAMPPEFPEIASK